MACSPIGSTGPWVESAAIGATVICHSHTHRLRDFRSLPFEVVHVRSIVLKQFDEGVCGQRREVRDDRLAGPCDMRKGVPRSQARAVWEVSLEHEVVGVKINQLDDVSLEPEGSVDLAPKILGR